MWTSLIHLDAFFSLILIFSLFPWTNIMQPSKQSLVRWMRFHGYHFPDSITHIKNGGSFKKHSKFTPTIHINPNSYSFRIMFIMIIVRFFIICFINGGKYEKVVTDWDRIINWCVYLTWSLLQKSRKKKWLFSWMFQVTILSFFLVSSSVIANSASRGLSSDED